MGGLVQFNPSNRCWLAWRTIGFWLNTLTTNSMLQYSDKHDRSPTWIFDDCMYLKVHETLPPGNLLNPIPDLVKRKIDAEEPWTPPIWWSHVDWSWKVPKHPMVYYHVPILKSYLGVYPHYKTHTFSPLYFTEQSWTIHRRRTGSQRGMAWLTTCALERSTKGIGIWASTSNPTVMALYQL